MMAANCPSMGQAISPGIIVIDLPDVAATVALAGRLAAILRGGDIVALDGDLGAGKTCLARAVIQALGDPEEPVPSPTFTLVQTYELPEFLLWHFDLYRLESAEDAFELDIEEAFATGVSLIEWPGRLGQWLPAGHLEIRLEMTNDGNARRANFSGSDLWIERLAPLRDD